MNKSQSKESNKSPTWNVSIIFKFFYIFSILFWQNVQNIRIFPKSTFYGFTLSLSVFFMCSTKLIYFFQFFDFDISTAFESVFLKGKNNQRQIIHSLLFWVIWLFFIMCMVWLFVDGSFVQKALIFCLLRLRP